MRLFFAAVLTLLAAFAGGAVGWLVRDTPGAYVGVVAGLLAGSFAGRSVVRGGSVGGL